MSNDPQSLGSNNHVATSERQDALTIVSKSIRPEYRFPFPVGNPCPSGGGLRYADER
jgi:hypothetical protein